MKFDAVACSRTTDVEEIGLSSGVLVGLRLRDVEEIKATDFRDSVVVIEGTAGTVPTEGDIIGASAPCVELRIHFISKLSRMSSVYPPASSMCLSGGDHSQDDACRDTKSKNNDTNPNPENRPFPLKLDAPIRTSLESHERAPPSRSTLRTWFVIADYLRRSIYCNF